MGAPRKDHAQLLSLLMNRKKDSVVHTYSNGFSGIAAHLSDEEAKSIAQRPEVVSVFRDPILQLHTTRSWDFLKSQNANFNFDSNPTSSPSVSSRSTGTNTIIGILDTGIWPKHPSFNDKSMGPIPFRWKGKCMPGENSTLFKCNRKVIGARYYDHPEHQGHIVTPKDEDGHGTHVVSTAAGRPSWGASYKGLAKGIARGASPGSRIAMYRVCGAEGCPGSAILKGFDDAIGDGVDVLSISLGGEHRDFLTDAVTIGAFHAVEKGITVVCSVGNRGPSPRTVENFVPWVLSVAATTIDCDFEVAIVLGRNKVIKGGGGINFSSLNKSAVYHLVDGRSASSNQNDVADASNCVPGSLDDVKVKGNIVLCEYKDTHYLSDKIDTLKKQGAIGIIIVHDLLWQFPFDYGTTPFAAVTEGDGAQIRSYINSTSNPLATILPTEVILDYKPAPLVAAFSARGPPTYVIENLLKPDVAAPGVAILAAWPPLNDTSKEPPHFNINSGTSMACPHVSGLAATVKSQHPTWSPSAIRSAIMTTAIQTNNLHVPITIDTGSRATPYDIGAGEISLFRPLWPGLVYETKNTDYVQFLCNMGYNTSASGSKMKRTVTNVGGEYSTYTATVEAPASIRFKWCQIN